MNAEFALHSKALRKLFLTIFLRGRGARGVQKEGAPKSIGSKLALTLAFYALFGSFGAIFATQGFLALSLYLHTSTVMFIGMFVASSAGEALFNKEEADILLHRPVTPRALLWAKVRVMVEVSVWLAGAFNLVGLIIGAFLFRPRGLFLVAHSLSVVMIALFCVGLVVVTYQLCLRWFGRERLDALITTAQTAMAILIVVGSQLAPQVMMRAGGRKFLVLDSWWMVCLPPAWFAGFDDAIAGSGAASSWVLAAVAMLATALVLWAGLGKLAGDYGAGLQTLNEAVPTRPSRRKTWLPKLVNAVPLRWFLRDPISRASFLLCCAYLVRDRDVKLRVYPGIAPMLIMPVIMLLPQRHAGSSNLMMIAWAGAYLAMIPLFGLTFMRYSSQWQAADVFRMAPIAGPAPLMHGARNAVFLALTAPTLLLAAGVIWLLGARPGDLKMLIPGLVLLPIFGLLPCLRGEAVPFAEAIEQARSATRGLSMLGCIFFSLIVAGAAAGAQYLGFFWNFVAWEFLAVLLVYWMLLRRCEAVRWKPLD